MVDNLNQVDPEPYDRLASLLESSLDIHGMLAALDLRRGPNARRQALRDARAATSSQALAVFDLLAMERKGDGVLGPCRTVTPPAAAIQASGLLPATVSTRLQEIAVSEGWMDRTIAASPPITDAQWRRTLAALGLRGS